MPCCCAKTFFICDVNVCAGSFSLPGIVAPADGRYIMVLDYLDVKVTLNADLLTGDPLTFESTFLNENFTYSGKVFGPDALPMEFTIGGTVYDCIAFNTKQFFSLSE